MIHLLEINLATVLLNIFIILLILAVVWLIIYVVNRIVPGFVDIALIRIIMLIVFLLAVIYWLTGHTLVFW